MGNEFWKGYFFGLITPFALLSGFIPAIILLQWVLVGFKGKEVARKAEELPKAQTEPQAPEQPPLF